MKASFALFTQELIARNDDILFSYAAHSPMTRLRMQWYSLPDTGTQNANRNQINVRQLQIYLFCDVSELTGAFRLKWMQLLN